MSGGRNFQILSADEMRRKYGLVAENRPVIKLDPANVPAKLRLLIPLAELWGVGDDLIRDDMIKRAPRRAIEDLKKAVNTFDDLMDEWLAGSEANNPNPSDEYLAFSAMRMAADMA